MKIKLSDIYDEYELEDEMENKYHYIDPEDLEKEFTVQIMSPEEAKSYKTVFKDMTVYEAYQAHANEKQKDLVSYKAKYWDDDRIILVLNDAVLDGNHHLVAGIIAGRPIKYIDLGE